MRVEQYFSAHARAYCPLRGAELQKDTTAVLVVAGGEGMGPVEKTCAAIAKACGAAVQMVVVCGRNAQLSAKLQGRRWPEGMHVLVQVAPRPRPPACPDTL